MWWRSTIWVGFIFGTIVWFIPNLIWLAGWCVSRLLSYNLPWYPFAWTALALVLVVWGGLLYGYYRGRFLVEVNQLEYTHADIPKAFEGFRIVHISDLHADSFEDTADLQKVVDKVNDLNPDIILFTGDMTTGSMEDLPRYEHVLKQLRSRNGVMSVLGNHDFFIYDQHLRTNRERCIAADQLTRYEEEVLGWKVLRNSSAILQKDGESIAIAGVDNINGGQGFHTIQKGDLRKAMQGLGGYFTILMSHDPSHWRSEVLGHSHVHITLSGHTHAAQARVFGWSLARLLFNECDGRYDHDGRMLYVNAGIGCTAPFRIGCPAEITLITLL